MDMSFSTQALACEWVIKYKAALKPQVYDIPAEIDDYVAGMKLASMGINIDKLTEEQAKYLSSWSHGT